MRTGGPHLVGMVRRMGSTEVQDGAASVPTDLLRQALDTSTSSHEGWPARVSALAAASVPHSAAIMWTGDHSERSVQVHGTVRGSSTVSASELQAIRVDRKTGQRVRRSAELGGVARSVLAVEASTGALLVLVDPGPPSAADATVALLWDVVAGRLDMQVSDMSPTYLMQSRAAAGGRAQVVTDLTDRQIATLESLLAVLRSHHLDDRGARQAAVSIATEAAVDLRTSTDQVTSFSEEPVTTAFERLRDDLRPLIRYRDVDVQLVEPPIDGRALPSEVANGARAVVRGVILALVDQPSVERVRVQWDCDGTNLLINVRDDGPGDLTIESPQLQLIRQRVTALNGSMRLAATTGWGSEMSVVMPLDAPQMRRADARLTSLSVREREVISHVLAGLRNREIGSQMNISENTVKFHLASIFRKLEVRSRAELAVHVLRPQP